MLIYKSVVVFKTKKMLTRNRLSIQKAKNGHVKMGLFLGETNNKNINGIFNDTAFELFYINGIFNDTALESASLTRFALKAK